MCRIIAKSLLPFGVAAFCGIAVFYMTAPIDAPAPKLPESKWKFSSASARDVGSGPGWEARSPDLAAPGTPVGPSAPIEILEKPQAQYTSEARENGTQGTVRLKVVMFASGRIGSITPVTRLRDGLTEQAIEAAKGIKFKPAMVNGVQISKTVTVDYAFSIY